MEATPQPGAALVLARPTGTRTRRWPPAQRCGADRSNGDRCGRYAVRGGDRCPVHGSNRPEVRKAYADNVLAARLGVASLVDAAIEALERALASDDLTVSVRAAQAVLDRLVPKTGGAVHVGVAIGLGAEPQRDPTIVIRERLAALRADKVMPSAKPQSFAESLAGDTSDEVLEGELVDEVGGWS